MQVGNEKDRLYSLEEVMTDLAVMRAEAPDEKFELIINQLKKLENRGWPEPQSTEAVIKIYELFEKEGVNRGYHYPVYCPELKKTLQYSRSLFLLETGCLIKGEGKERERKVIAIAQARGVTSDIAYMWRVEAYQDGHDFNENYSLFLDDLGVLMFNPEV